MASGPSLLGLNVVYGYWGFTTIFLMWAAMMRATRIWGGKGFQGRAFGFLESGRGLLAALIGLGGLLLFSQSIEATGADELPVQRVFFWASMFILALGLLVAWLMPSSVSSDDHDRHWIVPAEFVQTIKDPRVWGQGMIIVCAYVGYKMTDDFALFAHEVLGFDDVQAAGVGTAALWCRPLFALTAGLLADRIGSLRMVQVSFALMVVGGGLMFSGYLDDTALWALLNSFKPSRTLGFGDKE